MEAKVANTGICKRLMELLDHPSGLRGPSESISEHETTLLPFRAGPQLLGDLPLLVLAEAIHDHRWHHEGSPAPLRFRWHKRELAVDALQLIAHADRPAVEIDVFPSEAKRLALTKSQSQSDREERFETVPTNRAQELPGFFWRWLISVRSTRGLSTNRATLC